MTVTESVIGSLLTGLPPWVSDPPIEAVVFAFGVGEDGQLGLDAQGSVLSPKVLEALLGTRLRGRGFSRTPLIAGSRNTVAISSDGDVYSFGWNSRATLGHGHRSPVPKPKRVAGLRGVKIVQVALGGWHTLYLDSEGQMWASGGDEYMQSGQGAEERDVLVPTLCLPALRVCQVAAGGMHSLALTQDGRLWTWGEPWGSFSMTIDRRPRMIDVRDEEDGSEVTFVAIAAGAFHNLALTASGEVYSWGLNDYGMLGNGSTASVTAPQRVYDGLEGVAVADITCGGWHSLVIDTAGECYVWGRGEYGRLGLGDKSGSSRLRPTKLTAMQGHKVVQASCGGSHTMFITADGRAWASGRGSFGRLGTGSDRDALSPVEIKLPGGPERWHVIAVAAGGRHSLVFALPDSGDLDERAASGYSERRPRSPMGLTPNGAVNGGAGRFGGTGPVTVEHVWEEGGSGAALVTAAAAVAGVAGPEILDEVERREEEEYEMEEEEEEDDGYEQERELSGVEGGSSGEFDAALVSAAAGSLAELPGGGGGAAVSAAAAFASPVPSPPRSPRRRVGQQQQQLEDVVNTDEEEEGDSDLEMGSPRYRQAAAAQAAAKRGLRDDLLGDRS